MRKLVTVLGAGLVLSAATANAENATPPPNMPPIAQADPAKPAAGEAPKEGGAAGAVEEVKEPTNKVSEEGAAAAEKVGLKGGEPYGPAGCGLGSLIFKPDSGVTQIFASTTNGLFSIQTFGITSGTSNCDVVPGKAASARAFVEANRTALAKDIARGRGETIASLSELAGCADARNVGRKLQKNFKTIFPNAKTSDRHVGDSVLKLLEDEKLQCGVVDANEAETQAQSNGADGTKG